MSRLDLPRWLAGHTREALLAASEMPNAIAQKMGFHGSDKVMDNYALDFAEKLEGVAAKIRRDVARAQTHERQIT
ncbi:hypothetical protein [Pseudovibrio sp. Tun.PSC04-5.I4]|uniref:hypothetical protein n=1 Tax=Pseudovibrio sp. Tun.PSC04-5.I4 TaxID=1798213 RepID=UPI000884FF1F|nr:hypothetical protein [Pseudovibrio sp. Tun.PSC04-5.I4]SDQ99013.1 hypothetical protein SAMN04515695_2202 [Pseudovibrio sp. Tun.PSC04-5.I4]